MPHEPAQTITYRRGIGLLGGTFDPIHTGHIAVARGALRELCLARVDFLPAPCPWQKDVLTPITRRIEMIRAAIQGEALMGVNLTEAARSGPTYTIDTLKALRQSLGSSLPLVLIIGADQWENFHTWKCWQDFLDFTHIALCNRSTRQPRANEEVEAWAAHRKVARHLLTQTPCGAIAEFSIPPHEANSSKIRLVFSSKNRYEALRELEPWLPPSVAALISRHNIYSNKTLEINGNH